MDPIFHSGTYFIKILLGMNPCIQISILLIAGMISGKLCPYSFFADGSRFNTHFWI